MILQEKIRNVVKTNHHAHCLEGAREEIFPVLLEVLEKEWEVKANGNPDFWVGEFESFGIGEARAVQEMESRMSLAVGGRKVFVIMAHTFTHPAQNALLKVFEEPSAGTHFFVITRSAGGLLPTLRSRMVVTRMGGSTGGGAAGIGTAPPADFLRASLAERLGIARSLADDIADEKRSRAEATALLDEVERALYQKTDLKKAPRDSIFALEEIERGRLFLESPGASVKMILEHLALVTPHTK